MPTRNDRCTCPTCAGDTWDRSVEEANDEQSRVVGKWVCDE